MRVPVGLDGGHSVDLVARFRGQPVGDLGLHHHQRALDGREAVEHGEQDGHGHVVRQVRDERGRRRAGQFGHQHRVGVDQREAVLLRGHPGLDGGGQGGGEDVVDLDGDDPVRGLQQRERQRAEPRADLDDHVVRADLGGAHDPADRVGVDDEVLPLLLRRAYAEGGGQLPDVGRAEEGVGRGGGGVLGVLGLLLCGAHR